VLLLLPAAFLVLLVLAAITVDAAVVFGAQRNLVAAAGDAGNDAASLAIDRQALLAVGDIGLQPTAVDSAVQRVLRRNGIEDATVDRILVAADGRSAQIRVRRTVHLVFAPLIPGASRSTTVTATVLVTNLER
jgi:hypothetical protein